MYNHAKREHVIIVALHIPTCMSIFRELPLTKTKHNPAFVIIMAYAELYHMHAVYKCTLCAYEQTVFGD